MISNYLPYISNPLIIKLIIGFLYFLDIITCMLILAFFKIRNINNKIKNKDFKITSLFDSTIINGFRTRTKPQEKYPRLVTHCLFSFCAILILNSYSIVFGSIQFAISVLSIILTCKLSEYVENIYLFNQKFY